MYPLLPSKLLWLSNQGNLFFVAGRGGRGDGESTKNFVEEIPSKLVLNNRKQIPNIQYSITNHFHDGFTKDFAPQTSPRAPLPPFVSPQELGELC